MSMSIDIFLRGYPQISLLTIAGLRVYTLKNDQGFRDVFCSTQNNFKCMLNLYDKHFTLEVLTKYLIT